MTTRLQEIRRALARLQTAMGPQYRASIASALPHSQFATLRRYLNREWESAYPIRGFLATVGCESGGRHYRTIMNVVVAVELAQLASVILDDVIDRSDIRDGPAAPKLFGYDFCVVAADLIKNRASYLMTTSLSREPRQRATDANQIFEQTYERMCLGQLLDLVYERRASIPESKYFEMIDHTTAGFLEGAIRIGAVLGRAPRPVVGQLRQYARSLGIAFQLYDDLLDVLPRKWQDKPFGHDIRRRKKRLPLIHFLRFGPVGMRQHASRILRKTDIGDDDVRVISSAIRANGSLLYVLQRGKEFSALATEALAGLPQARHRNLLQALVELLQPENDDRLSRTSRQHILPDGQSRALSQAPSSRDWL